jgi:hypothetical protein
VSRESARFGSMRDSFRVCTLPWRIWPWGVRLTHSDTDMTPECSVEFGAMVVRPTCPYEELWVKVEFELAGFASAKPHRDDEDLFEVAGYNLVPNQAGEADGSWRLRDDEWLRTGICPDPGFYFSTDSEWLVANRASWASRQRTSKGHAEAVHFLLDGRDGYVEILASGFIWHAWPRGRPRVNEVSGEPVMSGRWTDRATPAGEPEGGA